MKKAIITLTGITAAAIAAILGIDEARAGEVEELLLNQEEEVVQEKQKGYFSLSQLVYPDGYKTKASSKVTLDKLSFYVSAANSERDSTGKNKGTGVMSVEIPVTKNLSVKPLVWGETENNYGQTSRESAQRVGPGIEAHFRLGKLDLKAMFISGEGTYKVKNADGVENTRKQCLGLRGLLYLGKGHYLALSGKENHIDYDHLGKMIANEIGARWISMGKRINLGLEVGQTNVKYNPGEEFSSPFAGGNLDFNLGKDATFRLHARHYFNGNRLSKSPIPRNEVGAYIVLPWEKARKENHHHKKGWKPYNPRGRLSRR